MPFAEINPPDIPILPGPGYKYLNSCPPTGNVYQDLVDLTTPSPDKPYLTFYLSSPLCLVPAVLVIYPNWVLTLWGFLYNHNLE